MLDFNILDDVIKADDTTKKNHIHGDIGDYDYAAALRISLEEYDDIDFAYCSNLIQRMVRLTMAAQVLEEGGDDTSLPINFRKLSDRYDFITDYIYETHLMYDKMVRDEEADTG